jgi:hypothetical protein
VIYSLLLARDEPVRQRQFQEIRAVAGDDSVRLCETIGSWTSALSPTARLPLTELSIPALRELSPEQYVSFRKLARRLIEADRQIDLFEYALEKCLDRHLAPTFDPNHRPVIQYYSIAPLIEDIARILSLLTRLGHQEPEAAARAYAEGMASLGVNAAQMPAFSERESGLKQADEALRKLTQSVPVIKKRFLQAAAHAVASDGELAPGEAEMLRAVADAVDCPIPPFIELHRATESSGPGG